jgi:Ca2+-binding RTX toxin-like protein
LFASTITTGSGSDTIELDHADLGSAAVNVTDFATGTGGDVFQLSGDDGSLLSLLSGWDGTSNPFGAGFFQLVQSGADTLFQWDQDGTANGASWETLVVFQNTNAGDFTDANFGGYPPNGGEPAGETITGTADDDFLVGTIGGDTIDALAGQDSVFGQGGADIIYGGDGLDNLNGGDGNDYIDGGNGDDSISGDDGNDQLYGQAGNDNVFGGNGDDQISGGDGNDFLSGESGNDIIAGGNGNDFLSGGDGADTFSFGSASEGADEINDFLAGTDHIAISASGFGGGLSEGGSILLVSGADPAASGTSGQFLYDTDDGNLYWDADGGGTGAAVLIATLDGAPPITTSDFIVGG